jgi:hypothetical protein
LQDLAVIDAIILEECLLASLTSVPAIAEKSDEPITTMTIGDTNDIIDTRPVLPIADSPATDAMTFGERTNDIFNTFAAIANTPTTDALTFGEQISEPALTIGDMTDAPPADTPIIYEEIIEAGPTIDIMPPLIYDENCPCRDVPEPTTVENNDMITITDSTVNASSPTVQVSQHQTSPCHAIFQVST